MLHLQEPFLYFIWEFQYFDKGKLVTSSGESLVVINPGTRNQDAGPDFTNAKVIIDGVLWAGCVELHVNGSDWKRHKHEHDQAYDNVVLHVVWKDDERLIRNDGTPLPTFELCQKVAPELLLKFRNLDESRDTIKCSPFWLQVEPIERLSMVERSASARLIRKADEIIQQYIRNGSDWNETAFQVLGRGFGFKVNALPFSQLCKSLPYRTVMRHLDRPVQVEALLFGQAGFLDEEHGDYYKLLLRREYLLLSKKYGLHTLKMKESQWKFLRLRPANFPTLRLAQFSSLLVKGSPLFSLLMSHTSLDACVEMLKAELSSYWKHHYHFNSESINSTHSIGRDSIELLMINSIIPLIVAYGKTNDDQQTVEMAFSMMQDIPSERNSITNKWTKMGHPVKSAFDSQGFLELYNEFCLKNRCLDCNIGVSIVKPRDHYN